MVQTMIFTVPTGKVVLQWPEDIDATWLDFAKEAIDIQLKAIVRRAIQRKDGDVEYDSWRGS